MKQKIIQQLPPSLFLFLKKHGWYGNFSNWSTASGLSNGYAAENILQQVKNATLQVKNGEACYERDSVLFDHVEYSWGVLSALMWIAAQDQGRLNIIDFGGSLGSSYYQNKTFLDTLPSVCWNIIEQPNFVEEGIKTFQNETLKFYPTIHSCIEEAKQPVQTILFSSVLQYLEKPFELLDDVFKYSLEYILIDRTGFTTHGKNRITIQKVPEKIYPASYPCWFFDENEFVRYFTKQGYECIADFPATDQSNIPSIYKGFIFRLKKNA